MDPVSNRTDTGAITTIFRAIVRFSLRISACKARLIAIRQCRLLLRLLSDSQLEKRFLQRGYRVARPETAMPSPHKHCVDLRRPIFSSFSSPGLSSTATTPFRRASNQRADFMDSGGIEAIRRLASGRSSGPPSSSSAMPSLASCPNSKPAPSGPPPPSARP